MDGKRAVVLDHVGNTLRLGHHLEDRQWSLDGIKKRDGNAAPSVKVCPVCFATSPSAAQVCEECGNIFPGPERHELKQVDGELVEMSTKTNYYEIGAMVDCDIASYKWFSNYIVIERLEGDLYKVKKHNQHTPWTVHVSRLRHPSAQSETNRQLREQGTAQSLEDLRQLAKRRGYKPGWAERVHQARLAKRHGA
jgi:hypothetical protein